MNKNEIQEKLKRIEEIEKQLSELRKQIEAEQVKKWPQKGEDIWWLATEGAIDAERFDDSSYDSKRLARGYFFKTREEAVEADRKRVAEIAYKNKIKEVNGKWKPDWKALYTVKRCLFYSFISRSIQFADQIGDRILDDSEYFNPYITSEQVEELKRLYAEWKGIDADRKSIGR
jgi:hypothetical protein